jgi:hypothetical protein
LYFGLQLARVAPRTAAPLGLRKDQRGDAGWSRGGGAGLGRVVGFGDPGEELGAGAEGLGDYIGRRERVTGGAVERHHGIVHGR